MALGWVRRGALALGVSALTAGAAQAAADDCRTVPVLTAYCFQLRQPHERCTAISKAAAPCFTVRGRLTPANGAPAFRLKIDRSKRILGVLAGDGDPNGEALPPAVRSAMAPDEPGSLVPLDGQFRVCPLATERPGWMRPVCLQSGAHLVAVQFMGGYDPPPTLEGQQE